MSGDSTGGRSTWYTLHTMTTGTERYTEQADVFLRQATEELARGDLRQAAEKGWGAAAQAIKAVAHSRGWEHGAHWHLGGAVARLTEETDDTEIASCFGAARSLHVSFYEGDLDARLIGIHLQDVGTLVDKLRGLL